jgi:hydrogenase/urease accessory protein HupE
MMKKLILLTCIAVPALVTPTAAFAHAGHSLQEQIHGFLHVEHLLILLAIGVALGIGKILKK